MSVYHIPVMASQCLDYLKLQPGAVYVDATLGAAGHSLAMLRACPGIRLYGFDRDPEAIQEARAALGDDQTRCELIQAPFSSLRSQLALRKIAAIDGILFDLGVSSHQLDEAGRGFSFDRNAALDMRMDRGQILTAAALVNGAETGELARIFREYGEERGAAKIARAIEKARSAAPLESTGELARVIESVAGSGSRDSLKTKLRVFQALRIAVNGELSELRAALHDAIMMLRPGGRAVVISYHSLEDRIVKHMFRDAAKGCQCPPRQMLCSCGQKPLLKVLTARPVSASQHEVSSNPRSRGAKLRAAEKLPEMP